MDLVHYIVQFRLSGETLFLLWHYGEPDGVLVNEHKQVVCFSSTGLLQQYAEAGNLHVNERVSDLYDLDYIGDWVHHPDVATLQPTLFLDGWNLFDDIRASTANGDVVAQSQPGEQAVYEKLFAANTSVAEIVLGHVEPPRWSRRDMLLLARVLREGLHTFASSITLLQ
jgi:hypothetical protein